MLRFTPALYSDLTNLKINLLRVSQQLNILSAIVHLSLVRLIRREVLSILPAVYTSTLL